MKLPDNWKIWSAALLAVLGLGFGAWGTWSARELRTERDTYKLDMTTAQVREAEAVTAKEQAWRETREAKQELTDMRRELEDNLDTDETEIPVLLANGQIAYEKRKRLSQRRTELQQESHKLQTQMEDYQRTATEATSKLSRAESRATTAEATLHLLETSRSAPGRAHLLIGYGRGTWQAGFAYDRLMGPVTLGAWGINPININDLAGQSFDPIGGASLGLGF